ncbi:hypothetical protein LTR28_006421 [Elasticomyces elasticus]|nr:hypothetical protein LTR50_004614 [Elasticomyces elasticus]KAK5006504.1 hypothetical protein LTR28_006421 [Elasticomyces elasticus]
MGEQCESALEDTSNDAASSPTPPTNPPHVDTPPSSDPPHSSPTSAPSARDRKLASLHARHAALSASLTALTSERDTLVASYPTSIVFCTDPAPTLAERRKLILAEAQATVKRHIGLLHQYNEIKDVGMGLLGLVADRKGVRVADVLGEFGVGAKD